MFGAERMYKQSEPRVGNGLGGIKSKRQGGGGFMLVCRICFLIKSYSVGV